MSLQKRQVLKKIHKKIYLLKIYLKKIYFIMIYLIEMLLKKYLPPCRRHLLRDPVGGKLQPQFLKFEAEASRWSSNPLLWIFLKGGYPRFTTGTCVGPSPLQASKNPTFSLSCRILRPCSPTLAPRCPNIARDSQENSILEPKSSNIPPKTLPRQPPGPSRGPNPQKTTKTIKK